MQIAEKTCDSYSKLTRCMGGFTYGKLQYGFNGADSITLIGAGEGGSDLSFAAPWEWIEENHPPGRFGLTQEDSMEVYRHISSCQSEPCKTTYKQYQAVNRVVFTRDGNPIDCIMVVAQFNPRNGSGSLIIESDNGFGDAVSALTPVFRWYSDHRDDFVWPGEGRVRLEGYVQVIFEPGGDEVTLKAYRADEGIVKVPFENIRKLRCGNRDIWRDTDLYHVEMSHPNETGYNKGGNVAIELMESQDGVEDLAKHISEANRVLKRV